MKSNGEEVRQEEVFLYEKKMGVKKAFLNKSSQQVGRFGIFRRFYQREI